MSGNSKCPIWGVPCESREFVSDIKTHHVQSSRAGGCYMLTENALRIIEKWNKMEKAKLSRWIYEQNQHGTFPKINSTIVQKALNWPMSSVPERIDFLLQFAEQQTRNTAEAPILHVSNISGNLYSHGVTDHTLNHTRQTLYKTLATTATPSLSALNYLMEQSDKAGFVKLNQFKKTDSEQVISNSIEITINGYKHLEGLKNANPNSAQAFVAMWFDETMNDAWENGFKPAIVDAGYRPYRVDREEFNHKIDDEIISQIRRSRFLVADFTSEVGPRGGVYYEAGFAHGLNLEVIFTCRKDMENKIHFDTRQYNHIMWETCKDLREKLQKRISARIGDGPHRARG